MNHEFAQKRFEGRTALVTGAASGIGLATARRLRAEGARVALADVSALPTDIDAEPVRVGGIRLDHPEAKSPEDASAPSDPAAPAAGCSVLPLKLDVTISLDWNAAMRDIEARFGGLDILIQCAGITGIDQPQDPERVSLESWRRVFSVNLEGALLGAQSALPLLRKSRFGSIVNVASLAGRLALPGAAAYAASKAALISFTRSLARHAAAMEPPIRVNCVLPGAIETPMWDSYLGHGPDRAARAAAVAADVPLRRFGAAEEVAAAIAYLASDDAKYVTGAEFVIDGGQSMRG